MGWRVLLAPQLSTLTSGLRGHGTQEVETRSELRLSPVHPTWAHPAQSAPGARGSPSNLEGRPRTPSPFLYPQITGVTFSFKNGKFFADLSGTRGGGALPPNPWILILLG